MSETIAVVIAAYDPGPYLDDALTSLATQTRPPDQVIVVDDGTPDDSVVTTVARHPGVTLLRQDRSGPAAGRNRGMRSTTTDHVLFLDADDRLVPTALELLEAALVTGIDLAYGATREFRADDSPPGTGTRDPQPFTLARIAGASLMRASLWHRIGPLDESLARGEWIDWMHRVEAAGTATIAVPEIVLERRLHDRNRTRGSAGRAEYVDVARAALSRHRARPPT